MDTKAIPPILERLWGEVCTRFATLRNGGDGQEQARHILYQHLRSLHPEYPENDQLLRETFATLEEAMNRTRALAETQPSTPRSGAGSRKQQAAAREIEQILRLLARAIFCMTDPIAPVPIHRLREVTTWPSIGRPLQWIPNPEGSSPPALSEVIWYLVGILEHLTGESQTPLWPGGNGTQDPKQEAIWLRGLYDQDEDALGWNVFADWLEEHGDQRSTFVRQSIQGPAPAIGWLSNFGVRWIPPWLGAQFTPGRPLLSIWLAGGELSMPREVAPRWVDGLAALLRSGWVEWMLLADDPTRPLQPWAIQALQGGAGVNFRACRSPQSAVALFTAISDLHRLALPAGSSVNDDTLIPISKMTELRHLDLYQCEKITNRGLASLASLSHLRYLRLSNCPRISDAGLGHLAQLGSLERVFLAGCAISGGGLRHLQKSESLRELKLAVCEKLTDKGLAQIGHFAKLESLDLAWCGLLTNDGMQHLAGLTGLKRLSLARTKITRNGLKHLQGLSSLRELNLARSLAEDDMVETLAECPITHLDLSACDHLTEACLSHVAQLPLERLDLSLCKWLTDVGLQHLLKKKSLREVNLSGCPLLTPAAVKAFRRAVRGRVVNA